MSLPSSVTVFSPVLEHWAVGGSMCSILKHCTLPLVFLCKSFKLGFVPRKSSSFLTLTSLQSPIKKRSGIIVDYRRAYIGWCTDILKCALETVCAHYRLDKFPSIVSNRHSTSVSVRAIINLILQFKFYSLFWHMFCWPITHKVGVQIPVTATYV